MNTLPLLLLLGVFVPFCIFIFLLGYTAAESRERRAQKGAARRIHRIDQWIKTNWSDSYEAYHQGYAHGYQQGITHSPTLSEETE
jgi:hypothetical protein